jgi:uncharacterized protein involved in exopolysaccharide biosynthesis
MTLRVIIYCVALALSSTVVHGAEKKADSESSSRKKEDKPSLEAQLETAKRELAQMITQFTEENPRVKAQRRKIADLEEAIAQRKREKA